MVHSERFERPTLGIEIRCSIQLSYECDGGTIAAKRVKASPGTGRQAGFCPEHSLPRGFVPAVLGCVSAKQSGRPL